MVDKFADPLMTPKDAAQHLQIPNSTMYYWLRENAAGDPLVHRVQPVKQGWPSVPFVAVVEAHVLRTLRDLKFTKRKVRAAAAEIRREFNTPYGLAAQRLATDGVDIFLHYADGELARIGDKQLPIREVIENDLRYITWDDEDGFPSRLRLKQYPDVAPVIIDPRFGWGTPVVATSKAPVDAVVGLWRAGEPVDVIADAYDLTRDQVDTICRIAA